MTDRVASVAVFLGLVVLIGVLGLPVLADTHDAGTTPTPTSDNQTVPPGERFQGAVGIQVAEVEGEMDARRFGVAFATAESNATRAAVVANETARLETYLAGLHQQRRTARRARANGSISDGEYRARIAELSARSSALERQANRTERAAAAVPAEDLSARGVNVSAIRTLSNNASTLRGPETARIARTIAGETAGRALAAENRPVTPGAPRGRNRSQGSRPTDAERGAPNRTPRDDGRPDARSSLVRRAGTLLQGGVNAVVGTAAAQSAELEERPLLEVPIRADGSGRVELVLVFDLSEDSAQRAFETLQDDDRARADVRERFRSRMASIAEQSASVTDRSMRVHDARLALNRSADGGTGVVRVSVAWEGLAAVEDEHLVVTEPFASGFTPDREFRVRITAPEEYQVTTTRPEPVEQDDAAVTWARGTELQGFTLVFSPAGETPLSEERIEDLQPERTISPANTEAPGFGAPVAILALLASVMAIRRKR